MKQFTKTDWRKLRDINNEAFLNQGALITMRYLDGFQLSSAERNYIAVRVFG